MAALIEQKLSPGAIIEIAHRQSDTLFTKRTIAFLTEIDEKQGIIDFMYESAKFGRRYFGQLKITILDTSLCGSLLFNRTSDACVPVGPLTIAAGNFIRSIFNKDISGIIMKYYNSFKTAEDFVHEHEYSKYVRETLLVGMIVELNFDFRSIKKGRYGIYVNIDGMTGMATIRIFNQQFNINVDPYHLKIVDYGLIGSGVL